MKLQKHFCKFFIRSGPGRHQKSLTLRNLSTIPFSIPICLIFSSDGCSYVQDRSKGLASFREIRTFEGIRWRPKRRGSRCRKEGCKVNDETSILMQPCDVIDQSELLFENEAVQVSPVERKNETSHSTR